MKKELPKWLEASPKAPLTKTVGSLLHDLNNPLTVLSARVFQLEQELESRTYNVQKLKDLCHSLSHVSEKFVQQVKLLKIAVKSPSQDALLTYQCHQLIQECLLIIQSQELALSVNWTYQDLTEGQEIKILPLHFQQLFLHLLLNAVQAASAQGGNQKESWIQITSKIHEDTWIVFVENSAPAPQEDYPDQIFEAFYTTKEGHSGLGLTLARHLSQKLNGKLERIKEHSHSVFRIQIPLSSD